MPINELEVHPFLESINDLQYGRNYFEGLIIGSFPVYAITNSVFPVEVDRFVEDQANMKYFYGSNQNSFWSTLAAVFEEPDPSTLNPEVKRVPNAKNLLTNNKLLISDSLYKTNRVGIDAQDSALMVQSENHFVEQSKSLNYGIDGLLQRNWNIKFLYFTSTDLVGKSPFGWFKDIFGNRLQFNVLNQVGNRPISAEVIIDGRGYTAFFLSSPAGNGNRGLQFTDNRRTQIFVNYIQSMNADFLAEIDPLPMILRIPFQKARLTELRRSFLIESWRQAFIDRNVGFNGVL